MKTNQISPPFPFLCCSSSSRSCSCWDISRFARDSTPHPGRRIEKKKMEMEMNGNLSNSSTNSNYNVFDSNACADSAGPMTSTPISERSMDGGDGEMEQPTSTSFTDVTLPKYGTVIPNRVFVGGISCQTTESELLQLFSKFGAIRGTKIIMDRAGVSKGYGFVTFETDDEAKRLIHAMNHRELAPIVHRDRRLNIAPAVKKQPMMRQNVITYGSQGSVGASSTFSPPPYDSYYYGQSPQGEVYGAPHQGQCQGQGQQQETYFPPVNGFSNGLLTMAGGGGGFSSGGFSNGFSNGFSTGGLANGYSSNVVQPSDAAAAAMGPYFSSLPNLGMGQAVQGPNGSILVFPMGIPSMPQMPCQQLNWITN